MSRPTLPSGGARVLQYGLVDPIYNSVIIFQRKYIFLPVNARVRVLIFSVSMASEGRFTAGYPAFSYTRSGTTPPQGECRFRPIFSPAGVAWRQRGDHAGGFLTADRYGFSPGDLRRGRPAKVPAKPGRLSIPKGRRRPSFPEGGLLRCPCRVDET